MNGRDLERFLSLIDANIGMTQVQLRQEVLAYLKGNASDVVQQLRTTQQVEVPTSSGRLLFSLRDLQAAAA